MSANEKGGRAAAPRAFAPFGDQRVEDESTLTLGRPAVEAGI
jgi:hypothetical protein